MTSHCKLYALAGAAVTAEIVGYLAWRPTMLRWGATTEAANEPLPGDDERTPHPRVQSTCAVTIDTPAEAAWPWLLQMGIGGTGFYSHDWVERVLGHAGYVEGRHSATRIHPEIPPLKVGDTLPMGAGAYAAVDAVEPYRYLAACRIGLAEGHRWWRRHGPRSDPRSAVRGLQESPYVVH
jgi:hypothetical protein